MQIKITKSLTELQDDAYKKLKAELYDYIINTNDFPEWKQTNHLDRWSKLSIMQLSTTLTTDELADLAHIENVRTWKNNLLAERDRVKGLVYESSATASSIKQAVDSFVYISIPIKP